MIERPGSSSPKIHRQLSEPNYVGLRENLQARLASGKISEGTNIALAIDSLEWVTLEIQLEELGWKPSLPVETVGDLLWLLKAMEFRSSRSKRSSRHN